MEHTKPYTISFCSGKRSVGKSVVAANIGFLLAESGRKVLICDTNFSYPNVHLIYGVEPIMRMHDILEGKAQVYTAIYPISRNLSLIASISEESKEIDEMRFRKCLEGIIEHNEFESIIFDCDFGAGKDVLECCAVSDMVIILISDEPNSLIDGYGLIKILQATMPSKDIRVIVNNVIDKEDADEAEQKLNRATAYFLSAEISSLGYVPYDRLVKTSIMRQELLVRFQPNSEAVLELKNIAHAIAEISKLEIYV